MTFLETSIATQSVETTAPADELLDQIAPAKLRIFETADRLFYSDGIRVVGIDRLISESNVTKATFYKHYGSKSRLILDYIEGRHARVHHTLTELLNSADGPEHGLKDLIGAITATIEDPEFRGCAFLNAATEYTDPEHPVRLVVTEHRSWYIDIVTELFAQLGHPRAVNAAEDYMLARDGAMIGGNAGDPIASANSLRRTVYRVIDEAHN